MGRVFVTLPNVNVGNDISWNLDPFLIYLYTKLLPDNQNRQ